MPETQSITLAEATALLKAAFLAADVPEAAARSVAAALVAAEAEGQAGHGFSRLGDYVAQVRSGKIRAAAVPSVHHRASSSLLIDAGCGFAFPALDAAIQAGLPVAAHQGVCVMAVANSHHCGALSVQVDRIAQAGFIGLMMANAPKAIAPWGAATPYFGTNPIAFACPVAGGEPLVIDLSLSRVARGKVMNAKKQGKPIPEGWALDAAGQPTTDAEAALQGTMLPIGGAKGTALALMVEILTTAFTGSVFSRDATSFFDAAGEPPRVGQTLIAIDPGAQSDFAERVASLLSGISAMEGTRLPGDRRRAAIAKASAHGLAVPETYLQLARDLAAGR